MPQEGRGDDRQHDLADQPGGGGAEGLAGQQGAAHQDQRQEQDVAADVEAVVDVEAAAELDEAAREQADERGDAAAQGQPQEQGLDAAQEVVAEQRRGQGQDGGDDGRSSQPQAQGGADQSVGSGATLGHQLQQDFGDAPLGHGQHEACQLHRQLVLTARLRAEDARQQDTHRHAEHERGETAQALASEAHSAPEGSSSERWGHGEAILMHCQVVERLQGRHGGDFRAALYDRYVSTFKGEPNLNGEPSLAWWDHKYSRHC